MNITGAKDYIIHLLKAEYRFNLYYHTIEHTLDVYQAAKKLIGREKVDPHTGLLIETAALFHDAGMTLEYKDHETASTEIAVKQLPQYYYSKDEIATICELIMITTMPQRAQTLPEKILCDADLDNLGREDFFINSFKLKLEWEMNGVLTCSLGQWLVGQKEFLEKHTYFTASAFKMRQEKKLKNLAEILEIINLL